MTNEGVILSTLTLRIMALHSTSTLLRVLCGYLAVDESEVHRLLSYEVSESLVKPLKSLEPVGRLGPHRSRLTGIY
jgi:hypothetical protein